MRDEARQAVASISKAQLDRIMPSLVGIARSSITGIDDKVTAFMIAATERWQPATSVHEVDEDAPPVFSDEEYDDFLSLVENVASIAALQEVARFFWLPEAAIEATVTAALANLLGETAQAKVNTAGASFVSHRRIQTPPQS